MKIFAGLLAFALLFVFFTIQTCVYAENDKIISN